jgi:hypothetical protein
MTAKSRYWDVERCCWVAYESPAVPSALGETDSLAADALPVQRADETAPSEAV